MNFTKLQATGNDFIFVDARNLERDWLKLAREMCHRNYGAGADGLILVATSNRASLKMRLFNSDGSEAEVSGNGLRCFAKYVIDRQIVAGPKVTVETMSGIRTIDATMSRGKVTHAKVNMGVPRFKAEEIPVLIVKPQKSRGEVDIKPIIDYPLTIGRRGLALSFVSMGNPHAVSFLSQPVADFPLATIGPKVENHYIFPERVNFGIARILARNKIEARVWERGAGETLSCGSGACAIAVIARIKGYIDDEVDIMLEGGDLTVYWDGAGEVYLSGLVEEVFTGEWPK
jgi:diaminopimelate epimerase